MRQDFRTARFAVDPLALVDGAGSEPAPVPVHSRSTMSFTSLAVDPASGCVEHTVQLDLAMMPNVPPPISSYLTPSSSRSLSATSSRCPTTLGTVADLLVPLHAVSTGTNTTVAQIADINLTVPIFAIALRITCLQS